MDEKDFFKLKSPHQPSGDQPEAIKKLVNQFRSDEKLPKPSLGVTGSGKTFTMAHVIAELGQPALILAPNKTLAGQLFSEFRELFPENAVEYFVSYYDYYQPEAYIPVTDTYIEKDSSINEQIDRMRHSATHSLLNREDVIIVSSVSCIYGLGSPKSLPGSSHSHRKQQRIKKGSIFSGTWSKFNIQGVMRIFTGELFGSEGMWWISFPPMKIQRSFEWSFLATLWKKFVFLIPLQEKFSRK